MRWGRSKSHGSLEDSRAASLGHSKHIYFFDCLVRQRCRCAFSIDSRILGDPVFESKRNQYISGVTMFYHIVEACPFLLCFYYSVVHLDNFITNRENGHTYLGECICLESVLTSILIADKISINSYYSNRHQFSTYYSKTQIGNFLIIAPCGALVAYILPNLPAVEILARFFCKVIPYSIFVILLVTYGVYCFLIMINSLPRENFYHDRLQQMCC